MQPQPTENGEAATSLQESTTPTVETKTSLLTDPTDPVQDPGSHDMTLAVAEALTPNNPNPGSQTVVSDNPEVAAPAAKAGTDTPSEN